MIKMDRSAIGKLLRYTNEKVPMRISRWRAVPMENDDRWRNSLSPELEVLVNKVRSDDC